RRLGRRLADVLARGQEKRQQQDHVGATRKTGKYGLRVASARSRASSPKARITAQSPPPEPLGLPAAPAKEARAQACKSSGLAIGTFACSPRAAMAAAPRRIA